MHYLSQYRDSAPYLNTLNRNDSAANENRALSHRELSARVQDPSRLSAGVGSLLLILIHEGLQPPTTRSAHTLTSMEIFDIWRHNSKPKASISNNFGVPPCMPTLLVFLKVPLCLEIASWLETC